MSEPVITTTVIICSPHLKFGEERHAKRIAHQIALDRHRSPIATTKQLTDTIYAALPGTNRSKRVVDKHPAMRTFQALRIFVNDEVGCSV